ncbi:hypothetical protein JYT83_00875 [bacterium AH-315-F18]|nr:hypothetical protein [bacterium AH-315-F18]
MPNLSTRSNQLLKLALILGLGVVVGILDGFYHGESWNRPVHWTSIYVTFGLLPLLSLIMTFFLRTTTQVITHILSLCGGYFLGFQLIWYQQNGYLWDDLYGLIPLSALLYIVGCSVLLKLRSRLEARAQLA